MTAFLPLKLVHVASAIVAVGANATYAFWLRRAGHDRDRLVFVIETVHRLDRRVANPAYGLLLLTGIGMVATGAYSFQQGWLATAIVLYVAVAIIGITVYAPAVRLQLAEATSDPSSIAYGVIERRTTLLGLLTLAIVALIVVLMVTKPF